VFWRDAKGRIQRRRASELLPKAFVLKPGVAREAARRARVARRRAEGNA
jgi:hypothetical protein